MPDPHRIERELTELLSRPSFSSIFHHKNEFRKPVTPKGIDPKTGKPEEDKGDTPAKMAMRTTESVVKNHPLLDPVEIFELRGPVQLYRAHDGANTVTFGPNPGTYPVTKSAGTLGGSWVERSVTETLWKATDKYKDNPPERKRIFMEFMRTSNFVLPEWNAMLYIVCMSVPAGHSVIIARGRGDWRAMRTNPKRPRPGGAPAITRPGDVMDHLGMMPIPGVVQCVVPLFNDNWIQPVPYPSAKWPFLT